MKVAEREHWSVNHSIDYQRFKAYVQLKNSTTQQDAELQIMFTNY